MAREIVVGLGGGVSRFSMSKVDRAKLYGRRKRVPLGPDGEQCQTAKLTDDGSTLVLTGMTSQGYFTDAGTWVPNGELVGLDDEGNEVEEIPSTLGVEQVLRGPVDADEVLDLRIDSVYALDPKDLDDALKQALDAGQVFHFSFNYRPGYQANDGYLVSNDAGEIFALVGLRADPVWQDVKAVLPTIDIDDDDDDELDFEMF